MEAIFAQQLPHKNFELVEGNIRSGQILYRDTNTGQEYIVPNVWYNQPLTWQLKAARFYAERTKHLVEYWKHIEGWEATYHYDLVFKRFTNQQNGIAKMEAMIAAQ